MQEGLKKILQKISETPDNDRLVERYRSLVASYRGTLEGVRFEIELARALGNSSPHEGLKLANQIFQEIGGHPDHEWRKNGLDCLQVMISIFKALGKEDKVDLLKKEVIRLLAGRDSYRGSATVVPKVPEVTEVKSRPLPTSSSSEEMTVSVVLDLNADDPEDPSEGPPPSPMNLLMDAGDETKIDGIKERFDNSYEGTKVKPPAPGGGSLESRPQNLSSPSSLDSNEPLSGWLMLRRYFLGENGALADLDEGEDLFSVVDKKIPLVVPYGFLKELVSDIQDYGAWQDKKGYWLILFFEGFGVEGTLELLSKADLLSFKKEFFKETISEMLKKGFARRALFLSYSLLSSNTEGEWAQICWESIPNIWTALKMEYAPWNTEDGPEALLALLVERRLPHSS